MPFPPTDQRVARFFTSCSQVVHTRCCLARLPQVPSLRRENQARLHGSFHGETTGGVERPLFLRGTRTLPTRILPDEPTRRPKASHVHTSVCLCPSMHAFSAFDLTRSFSIYYEPVNLCSAFIFFRRAITRSRNPAHPRSPSPRFSGSSGFSHASACTQPWQFSFGALRADPSGFPRNSEAH